MVSQLDLVGRGSGQAGAGGIVEAMDVSSNWCHFCRKPGFQICKNTIFDESKIRVCRKQN